jgi:hypothetical protein
MVLRFASIFAVVDASRLVRRSHLLAALEVWRYCEDSVAYIFGSRLGDASADRIYQALLAATDGLTQTEIGQKVFQNNAKRGEVARGLQLLKAAKMAVDIQVPTSGRARTVWRAVKRVSLRDRLQVSSTVVPMAAGAEDCEVIE